MFEKNNFVIKSAQSCKFTEETERWIFIKDEKKNY